MTPRPRPLDLAAELDPVAALARLVERVQRAQATQEEMLRGLAGDVAQLVATTPAQPPAPTTWLLTAHPPQLLAVLTDLVDWLRQVYLWYPGAVLPSCWLWHPAAIEELLCLRQYHAEAYHASARSVAKAMEFHERFLPGVLKRLAGPPYADCDLDRHAPTGGRDRAEPDTAPLHDEIHLIATAWMNQTIPEPTPTNLTDARAADTTNITRRKNQ